MPLRSILSLLIVCVVALAGEAAAQSAAPRSIQDVLKVLDQHQQASGVADKARGEADRQPPNTTDPIDLFNFYYSRAKAAQRIGRVDQQIADLKVALKNSPAGQERRDVLWELVNAEAQGGDYANALALVEQVRGLSLQPGAAVSAHAGYANFLSGLGDVKGAQAALAQAEAAMADALRQRESGVWRYLWLSRVERARGAVAMAEGKVADAEAALRRAVQGVERDMQSRPNVSNPEVSQYGPQMGYRRFHAISLARLGRYAEAELVLRGTLRIALERYGRQSLQTGIIAGELADLLFDQGRNDDGVALAREAIAILEASGAVPESTSILRSRRNIGIALAMRNRWAQANAEFEKRAAAVKTNDTTRRVAGVNDLAWSLALVRTGAAERAVKMLDGMAESQTKRWGESSYQVAETRGFRGIAYAARGDRAAALKDFREAVPVLVEHVNDQAAAAGGTRRAWRITQILEAYIGVLLDMIEKRETIAGFDAVAESFRMGDIARGGRVQLALSASAARSAISDPQLAELARKEQDAEQRIAALNELLSNMLFAPPDQQVPKIIEDLRQEISALRDERVRIKTDIEKRFPDYANLLNPKPATLAEVRMSLRDGEALVSLYVAADRTYVWAVPKNGEPAVATVAMSESDIAQRVAHLRKALDANAITIDDIPKFDVATAHALYSALLKPVESGWTQAKSVLIVPHQALGQLPFSLLPTAESTLTDKDGVPFEGYRQVPWLARRVAITQLPSVNTLVTLRRAAPLAENRRAYAGFGDPFFNKRQVTEAVLASADEVLGTRGARVHLRSSPKVNALSSAQLGMLPRLPDTRPEILDVAQAVRADLAQDVFLGERASVQAVKKASLANRRVIHFATHGLVPGDLDGLTQPALALTSPEVAPADGDGLLKMEDILALKLNADWVVLSACNTASADGQGSAEAVSGLGRAFFYAGARALLVSNWPVDSPSARKLMTELFKRHASEKSMERAEALRQAMLHLIDSGAQLNAKDKPLYSYAHPLFWAPFTLVGDGSSR